MIDELFKDTKPDFDQLCAFGFSENFEDFLYSVDIVDGQFNLSVTVSHKGNVFTELVELSTNETYVLHLIPGASGAFVGRIREEYRAILTEIAEKCFTRDVFKSADAKRIIEYVWNTYQDTPEYLWDKFPRNAIFRRKDTAKWYAALLSVAARKIGLNSDGIVEVINLRIDTNRIAALVDGKRYFPGYHMNKKHWITICLDGSVPIDEIFRWIDSSYALAKKR